MPEGGHERERNSYQSQGLRKEFGKGDARVRAVDEVDLSVTTGETVAVMGPSGCGKSTLLHLLGGLERQSSGEIELTAIRLDKLGERGLAKLRRSAVGFVFQAFHLVDELTARENVELPALLAGRTPRAARRRAMELLGRVGLADRAGFLRTYTIVGIAVTAAAPPYPNLCYAAMVCGGVNVPMTSRDFGMAWVTKPDAQALAMASGGPAWYLLNLRLSDPGNAEALATSYDNANQGPSAGNANQGSSLRVRLTGWPDIAAADGLLIQDQQTVLSAGAWLAGLLAIASVAVLAGGRMAEHTRRTGLLKAVGCTPGTVAVVLLAENIGLALLAAAAGLAIGWLTAPLITSPGAALLGTAGAPSVTVPIAIEVLAVALIVSLAATFVPAIRASRRSTVSALADAAVTPRRHALVITMSARLPVPLLLGVRLATRRLRRAALSMASVAVTVSGIVAVLAFHALTDQRIFGHVTGLDGVI